MRFSLRPIVSLSLFGVALSIVGITSISQSIAAPPETAPPKTTRPVVPPNRLVGEKSVADAQLASWLIVDNESEVALSKLAVERSRTPSVQKFAEQMVEEHTQLLAKLETYAVGYNPPEPRTGRGPIDRDRVRDRDATPRTDRDNTPRTDREPGKTPDRPLRDRIRDREDREPARTTERGVRIDESGVKVEERAGGVRVDERGVRIDVNPRDDQRGHVDFVRVKQELGEACQKSTRHEFEGKTAEEFDRCYIGFQIAAHIHAIDTMKVFQHYASNDFDNVLANGIKTAETHLEHAKKIAKELEGKTAATALRTTDRNDKE